MKPAPHLYIVSPAREEKIYECFDSLAEANPDQSTEGLLLMTADAMGCNIREAIAALLANTAPYATEIQI